MNCGFLRRGRHVIRAFNRGQRRSLSQLEVQETKDSLIPKSSEKTSLFAWGCSEHGGLGMQQTRAKRPYKYVSKPISHFLSKRCSVVDIQCGFGFSLFSVREDHSDQVFGTGLNTDFQVGYHAPRKGHPLELLLSPAPIDIGIMKGTRILKLGAGRAHSVVVTDKQGVFTFGSNCYGQCGRSVVQEEKVTPSFRVHKIMELDGDIVDVVCGQDHTVFLTEQGKVYVCGWGSDGQSGQGHLDNVSTPVRVGGELEGETIVKVSSRCETILALNSVGQVFGWGNNEYNQISGVLESPTVPRPIYLDFLAEYGRIIDIGAGGCLSMALTESNQLLVWGFGILGAGPKVESSKIPLILPNMLFGKSKVVGIDCGVSQCAALTNNGSLFTWGKNRQGSLGIGHIRDQFFPYRVAVGHQIFKVSMGFDHMMGLGRPF